ncbi:unnamed protein product [Staurois parvus]|uniref:Uncharacterized protein n=1 Tax=Staurois parvus TaxID=386267 RepID=A0ABN9E9A9_9NEOB|nr:unnamed protein product [Staurois parvus]
MGPLCPCPNSKKPMKKVPGASIGPPTAPGPSGSARVSKWSVRPCYSIFIAYKVSQLSLILRDCPSFGTKSLCPSFLLICPSFWSDQYSCIQNALLNY